MWLEPNVLRGCMRAKVICRAQPHADAGHARDRPDDAREGSGPVDAIEPLDARAEILDFDGIPVVHRNEC